MSPEHNNLGAQTDILNRLREDMRAMGGEIVCEEADWGIISVNVQRIGWASSLVVSSNAAKRASSWATLDVTQPGLPHAYYSAHGRVGDLVVEVQRAVSQVTFPVRSWPHSRPRTWQFMFVNLLQQPGKFHKVTDDLESFLHVLGWMTLRYVPAIDSYDAEDRGEDALICTVQLETQDERAQHTLKQGSHCSVTGLDLDTWALLAQKPDGIRASSSFGSQSVGEDRIRHFQNGGELDLIPRCVR
ncbi:hypothetical protein L210DRAFT_3502701 [Boletus edulis BED1]|uniref:Fungal-type protein kinase domain-containing protein n=1 Tax=Boletus edulis BED1 TaxID=1328754 RepID=A0AAD4BZ87_BOLED|nr:hypothetical protein L210DRAFT_3502701 [Boletus edulis BED1]